MKKLILTMTMITLALAIISAPAFGQGSPIAKKTWQLSGGISFASFGGDLYKVGNDKPTAFSLTPGVNYFFLDGVAAGAKILYSKYSIGDYSTANLGIGPQVTYYFNINKEKSGKGALYPYLGVAFLYSTATDKVPGTPDVKSKMTTFSIDGGAAYMLTNSVGLFGQLEYDADSGKQTDPVETDSMSGSVISIFTGFTFFIY